MGLYEQATLLGVLAGGRKPTWAQQTDAAVADGGDFPLPTASSGASMVVGGEGALLALVSVGVREVVAYRTARVTIETLDLGETYTVTIDGTDVDYDSTGDADSAEVLAGIADAINADGTVGPLVVASVVDSAVVIAGQSEADYTIDLSATGSGVLACVADASACTLEVYGLAGRANSPDWRLINGAADLALDERGLAERVEVAGFDRLYLRCTAVAAVSGDGASVTYRPVCQLGPCGRE
jgi:hypothetical protein